MYRLIGADQKEYGPMSAENVRRCIAERRAHRLTLARAESDIGWKPLGDFPEFQDALAPFSTPAVAGAAPPIPPCTITAPPVLPVRSRRTSGLAISSLVLGIFGFCGITGLAGLITGVLALVQIKRARGAVKGTGLAIAGIIVSTAMLAVLLAAAIIIPIVRMNMARQFGQPGFNPQPVFRQPQGWTPDPQRCEANVKAIVAGALHYATDNGGRFPQGTNWCDVVQVYLPSLGTLRCPNDGSNDRCSYALNSAVSGLPTNQVGSKTVVIFESRSGWNQSGDAGSTRNRHGSRLTVGFADGTTGQISAGQAATLRWEP